MEPYVHAPPMCLRWEYTWSSLLEGYVCRNSILDRDNILFCNKTLICTRRQRGSQLHACMLSIATQPFRCPWSITIQYTLGMFEIVRVATSKVHIVEQFSTNWKPCSLYLLDIIKFLPLFWNWWQMNNVKTDYLIAKILSSRRTLMLFMISWLKMELR